MNASPRDLRTQCCIVGGGPAGMMLGLLLARAGVDVTVLEKHRDFLRDFRGDTVHPSTLEILDQIGLLDRFQKLGGRREDTISMRFADRMITLGDFSHLRAKFPYLVLIPQWDFLDLLADEAKRYPNFRLLLETEGRDLLRDGERVVGVRAFADGGPIAIRSDLVVATDGRHSDMRRAARLASHAFGAPMDVMWFRLPVADNERPQTYGVVGKGELLVMINRNDYWQSALVIPKGTASQITAQPIEQFHARLSRVAPFLGERARSIATWDQVKLLEVQVDYLKRWHMPGLLLIGDAAHAMSPVGGVGINLAIQDAVATANIVGPAHVRGEVPDDALLSKVQARRRVATHFTQAVQRVIQHNIIARALDASGPPPNAPRWLATLLSPGWVRSIAPRVFGLGFDRERLELPARTAPPPSAAATRAESTRPA
ncbi:MAG TPA: FAD-dependent oxidoreductase [Polyangiales bacterium]|nr:FAD-dependent oxidoreductase [Polyangiales bacterium]